MTIINLEASVKNLVTSAGLSLASSGNTVTLSLNNSGLAQILSQILESSATVTVSYNASTNKISFTSTGGGSGGGGSGSGVPPLIITNKNQFTNNSIPIALNQDVFLLATSSADWEPGTYTLDFPSDVSEPSKHLLFIRYSLPSNSNVEFTTGNLNANYNLNTLPNQVLMAIITPDGSGAIYGSMSYVSP